MAPAVTVAVLALAFLLGQRASFRWLALLVAGTGGVLVLARPILAVFALVAAALLFRIEIGSGTEVNLNTVTLLVPVMATLWLLDMIRRRRMDLTASPANRPLLLFLAVGLLSLLIGRATWDPRVPLSDSFLLAQLAQWAIFAFSALAFWLAAGLIKDEATLKRLTTFFLLLAGGVAILRLVPGASGLVQRLTSLAFLRAPLWVLLAALGSGQLLFNRQLSLPWRAFLLAAVLGTLVYAFVEERESISNWVGLATALGTLTWLRFPRLRWPLIVLVLIAAAVGALFPTVYEFAGGDAEWQESGGSRLLLTERVIEVTMRNPITGLGPAGYRPYAAMEPLKYGGGYWIAPKVNSHNNYVDIFSHTGVVGLALFLWFMVEIARSAGRVIRRFQGNFATGFANGMLGVWMGMMVIMLLLDWFLPFIYNVGFTGFQASVLVWLFMGGLVALENVDSREGTIRGEADERTP